jgi:hypothetical protein
MQRPEAVAEALDKLRIGKFGTVLLGCNRSTVLITSWHFSLLKSRVQGNVHADTTKEKKQSPPGSMNQKWKNAKGSDRETFVSIRPTSRSLHTGVRPFT